MGHKDQEGTVIEDKCNVKYMVEGIETWRAELNLSWEKNQNMVVKGCLNQAQSVILYCKLT